VPTPSGALGEDALRVERSGRFGCRGGGGPGGSVNIIEVVIQPVQAVALVVQGDSANHPSRPERHSPRRVFTAADSRLDWTFLPAFHSWLLNVKDRLMLQRFHATYAAGDDSQPADWTADPNKSSFGCVGMQGCHSIE
jgi:hypothetical protein